MSFYVVDVESDGPIPPVYSMVCFGAVLLSNSLDIVYYGSTKPISEQWIPEALAVSGFSREEHLGFNEPLGVMRRFKNWIESTTKGRPVFISDNLAYDWQWINYYFHSFCGENPFGHSGRRINDIYSGLVKDVYKSNEWKKLRKTKHTHNPVDDAKGNAEALLEMKKMGLKI